MITRDLAREPNLTRLVRSRYTLLMARSHPTVLLDKTLHRALRDRIRNVCDAKTLISRLVEMYLKGEITVTLPERKV